MKQIVVRGYSRKLKWARPLVNTAAALFGEPGLPRVGTSISHAYISHFAVPPDQPQLAECLINSLRDRARASGIDYLMIGFDSRDPRLAHLRSSLRPREYESRIYVVYWPDGAAMAEALDDRLLAPEVATL